MILVDQNSAACQKKTVRRQQSSQLGKAHAAAERLMPAPQTDIMPIGNNIQNFRQKKLTAYSGSMTAGRNRNGDALFVFYQLEEDILGEFCGKRQKHFGKKVNGGGSKM